MINKILIVDDSPIARKMLIKSILKNNTSYEIIEAVNGQDGVDKFRESQPDMTFMDLTMPVLDGYHALAKIRTINKNALVVVLTADIQPKSIANVMDAGAFTVIKKPAKPESIESVLSQATKKLQASKEK